MDRSEIYSEDQVVALRKAFHLMIEAIEILDMHAGPPEVAAYLELGIEKLQPHVIRKN